MSARKTYSEKLKDPRWQKKRLKIMEYAKWRCQICGAKGNTLHCHHSYYTRGKQPWQYPDGSIICICESCHAKIHEKPPVSSLHVIQQGKFDNTNQTQTQSLPDGKFSALRIAVEGRDLVQSEAPLSDEAHREKFAKLRECIMRITGNKPPEDRS